MLQEFLTYFKLGFSHITDLAGYDHLLFLVALCAVYRPRDWKKIALLVTAFTIGHCLTLLLAGRYGSILEASVTEILVAATILLGGVYNLAFPLEWHREKIWPIYTLAGGFGLVHGLAFSNFFRALGSAPEELWRELLAFNLGVEIGQLLIVTCFFLLYFLFFQLAGNFLGKEEEGREKFHHYWYRAISIGVIIMGAWMIIERV